MASGAWPPRGHGYDVPVTPPVQAVAFDVNETLFDLAGLRPRFTEVGLGPEQVPLWFSRVLRDGFALTVLGDYRPFREVGASVLHALDPRLEAQAVDRVLDGFSELDPHPDVEPALRRLGDAGVPAVTLTNGAAAVTRTLLDRAGLAAYVTATLSVDDVRRWKPAPEPYLHAARACGAEPGSTALVAAHAWDVYGAGRAGLRTAWLPRSEPRFAGSVFPAPDVHGSSLPDAVEQLLRPCAGSGSRSPGRTSP